MQCPSWQWGSGDEASLKDYLPREKQFLVTRNVPCYKRCRQMDYAQDQEKEITLAEGEDGEEGWVDTHHYLVGPAAGDGGASSAVAAKDEALALEVSELLTLSEKAKEAAGSAAPDRDGDGGEEDEEEEEEALDMDDFIESGMLDEAALDLQKELQAKKRQDQDGEEEQRGDEGVILSTRTYDLNITYDKYYQTPRLWLFGYDENRKALSVDEMYEDFSADHANKTITMETHPHLPGGPPQASVHPCRHAQVMKKLIDQIVEGGNELGVHMYLIVFLKFVQAIIPTIEYDFTKNFAL